MCGVFKIRVHSTYLLNSTILFNQMIKKELIVDLIVTQILGIKSEESVFIPNRKKMNFWTVSLDSMKMNFFLSNIYLLT